MKMLQYIEKSKGGRIIKKGDWLQLKQKLNVCVSNTDNAFNKGLNHGN